jgi:hypothetical protein
LRDGLTPAVSERKLCNEIAYLRQQFAMCRIAEFAAMLQLSNDYSWMNL